MKIKHWQGYGTVTAQKIPDKNCTLHVRVTGNHEWGLRRDNDYDLFRWLVKRFDKRFTDYDEWYSKNPNVVINEGYIPGYIRQDGLDLETCDYYFTY